MMKQTSIRRYQAKENSLRDYGNITHKLSPDIQIHEGCGTERNYYILSVDILLCCHGYRRLVWVAFMN